MSARKKVTGMAVAGILVVLSAAGAQGAVVLFRPATGGHFSNYSVLPQGCGDRITATTQGGFSYGLAGGATPNIVSRYNVSDMPTIRTWGTDFGDLVDIVTTGGDRSLFEYDLIADPGHLVSLSSFDMAVWPATLNYNINSVSVLDGNDNVLFMEANALIIGTGTPAHSHFEFSGVAAPTIKVKFDATNVDADDVGLTNITFSQTFYGDANLDGKVDFADFQVLLDHWMSQSAGWAQGDFTGDGTVDFADFQKLLDNWNPAGSMESTPEPTTVSMLILGTLISIRRRPRAGPHP